MQADQQHERKANAIRKFRGYVNFDYGWLRTHAEKDQNTVDARKAVYEADLLRNSEPDTAVALYETGLRLWRKVLDTYPDLLPDDPNGQDTASYTATIEELTELIDRYAWTLDKIEREFPENFVLQDVRDWYTAFRASQGM